jgi:HAD superfamily hydrolase (TIGR01662 family)
MSFSNSSSPSGVLPWDLVLFDLGNTLIYFDTDWRPVIEASNHAMLETLDRLGYHFDPQTFLKGFGRRMQAHQQIDPDRPETYSERTAEDILADTLKELGVSDVPAGHIHEILQSMFRITEAHWTPEADARETLLQLRSQGYRLGLISNANYAADAHTLIDRSGVGDLFELAIISAEEGVRKPHPALFQKALDFFQVPAQRAVMVGDTLVADILGANRQGMGSIWITRRVSSDDHQGLPDVEPTAAVHSLAEIPDVLRSLPSTSIHLNG